MPVPPGPRGDNPAALGPAGTVHATLEDWARFVSLHLRKGDGKKSFLKAKTLNRLHTPSVGEDYASGWIVAERPWGGGKVLTHSGSNTMWFAVTWIAPERGFAVLVTCNLGDSRKACDEAASALIQRFQKR